MPLMNVRITSLLLAVFLVLPCGAQDTATALIAPAGFQWQEFQEIKAKFLMPFGWHFKHVGADGSDAYFITLQNIDVEGGFRTGLSVNTVPNISKASNLWVKQYARAMHEAIKMDSTIRVITEWENPQGVFVMYGLQYEKQILVADTSAPAADPVRVHQLIVANERTDRLYVITFESNSSIWPAAWEIGTVLTTKFVLDENT